MWISKSEDKDGRENIPDLTVVLQNTQFMCNEANEGAALFSDDKEQSSRVQIIACGTRGLRGDWHHGHSLLRKRKRGRKFANVGERGTLP